MRARSGLSRYSCYSSRDPRMRPERPLKLARRALDYTFRQRGGDVFCYSGRGHSELFMRAKLDREADVADVRSF